MVLLLNLSSFLLGSHVWQKVTLRHQIILVSPRFSTFVSLVQRHLLESNPFSFSSLLYFCQSRTEPSQGIESSQFFLVSLLWPVWHKAWSQTDVMLSSSLPRSSLSVLPGSKYFLVYIIFRIPTQILVVTSLSAETLHIGTPPLACHPHNLRGTSAGD